MKQLWAGLWQSRTGIDRRTYALVGVIGFAIKHNLDRFIARYVFHRPWHFFNYWIPAQEVSRITQLGSDTSIFLGTMLMLALPFIWVGVTLTMKRLRSAGLPNYLAALFFVPFLNLLFFVMLCLWPETPEGAQAHTARQQSWLFKIIPDSRLGSAAVAMLITVPIGCGLAALGVYALANYGWGLFVALPFAMGFAAALLYGMRQPRTANESVSVACLSVVLLGAGFFALAFEGVICLLMALPIALPLAAFGGYCANQLRQVKRFQSGAPAFLGVLLLLVPGTQTLEHWAARPSPLFVVRSSVEIHASPEKVWNEVVAFSEIPQPTEWLFRAGIAYPIRAEITGRGVGADRHCVFSTGAFVEPIQVWDEPHLLKFSVTSNPAPMEEWTPYAHIQPPHLHGFLVSEGGQFLLTPLPDGGTRLEGTTWYHHGLWPSAYWRLWSDVIIHEIHMRVLQHIREQAESRAAFIPETIVR